MVLIYAAPVHKWKCVFKECKAMCCTGGREVTAEDIKRISKATGLVPQKFAELKDEKGLFRLKSVNGKCFFLNKDYACPLHEKGVKPLFCRMYPFKFDGIIYSDEVILKIRAIEDCPGIGRGTKLKEDFEKDIEEFGNKFVREIKDFLRLKGEGKSAEEILRDGK